MFDFDLGFLSLGQATFCVCLAAAGAIRELSCVNSTASKHDGLDEGTLAVLKNTIDPLVEVVAVQVRNANAFVGLKEVSHHLRVDVRNVANDRGLPRLRKDQIFDELAGIRIAALSPPASDVEMVLQRLSTGDGK